MTLSRHFAFVAFLSVLPISAQQFPDAAALAEGSMQVPFEGRWNFEYTREISWQGEAGLPGADNLVALFQFSNGKFRIDVKRNRSSTLFVMDGQYLWEYVLGSREYSKIPHPAADVYARSLLGGGALGNQTAFYFVGKAQVVRSEIIDVDGKPHDCWVTELRVDTPSGGPKSSREMRNLVTTEWYDKMSGLVLMADRSAELRSSPTASFAPVRMKLTTRGLKLNAPLDDSLFVFAPPQDARDADAPVASVPAAGSSGPARTPAPPIVKQVPPAYPPLAKMAQIQGPVTFAVTIGKDGTVQDVAVISGNALLIEAAAAAVRQWIYQPTLVNGSPVEVHTTAAVNFTLTK